MHYNTVTIALLVLFQVLTTLFSQLHTETIIVLQSNGTPTSKALQDKQTPKSPDPLLNKTFLLNASFHHS